MPPIDSGVVIQSRLDQTQQPPYSLRTPSVLDTLCQLNTNLDVSGKREPRLRNDPHQTVLWVRLVRARGGLKHRVEIEEDA